MTQTFIIKKKSLRERLWKSLNIIVGISTVLNVSYAGLFLSPKVALAANPAADLEQCRNGSGTSPQDCTVDGGGGGGGALGWVHGNAGSSQSHYVEGLSIPYRLKMTNLTAGTPVVLTLGYDIKHSGHHAVDYLTSYNRLEPHVQFGHPAELIDPTVGTGVSGSPVTFAIPAPSSTGSPTPGQPTTSFNALPANEKLMSLWNGTFDVNGVSYEIEGDLSASQSETQITIRFTPTASEALLAWGGHIGSRIDWGFELDGTPKSAGGISGSPYHMRTKTWNIGNLGNQDRSLSAGAVIPPANLIVEKQTDPDGDPAEFTFTGDIAGPIGDGEQLFASLPPGTYTSTESALSPWNLSSIVCTDNDSTGNVGTRTATFVVSSGESVKCTFNNTLQEAHLIVIKHVENNSGGAASADDFTMTINGVTATGGNSFPGVEAPGTNKVVTLGAYNVTESGPDGYTGTPSADCTGTIAAGETKTCTFTNDDRPGTLIVNKVLPNDNGGTATADQFSYSVNGGNAVAFESDGSNSQTVNAGTYSVVETNPMDGYTVSYNNCTDVVIPNGGTATCTITNDDQPATLIVEKVLPNDNGGTATADQFSYSVNGGNAVAFESDGSNSQTVNAGTYSVVETNPMTGYTLSYDKCSDVVIPNGGSATCTITNDDQPATLIVEKVIPNDDGGTATANQFSYSVNGGGAVAFESDGSNSQTVNAGTYSVVETNPMDGYTVSYNNCTDVVIPNGGSATCTITNNDVAPRLTVIKHVINFNTGTQLSAENFTMNVDGENVSDSSFPGAETPGTTVTLDQGDYEVTEGSVFGYTPSYSADCSGSIAVGEEKTCVVTNEAIAPHLIVIKHVINDNGGEAVAGDFEMTINGVTVPLGDSFPGEEAPGTDSVVMPGEYEVTESGPSGYAASYSDDCNGSIDIGQTKFCTVTNDDIGPELTVIKHVVNDNGGNAVAADFTMNVTGENVSDPSFPGAEAPGTMVTLDQGGYSVDENAFTGYVKSFSAGCSGIINVGEQKTCTITNNDVAPKLTLVKEVIKNNGGDAQPNDFLLTIGGSAATSGTEYTVSANTPYALNETQLSGYEFVSLTGPGCPAELGGSITLNEGDNVTCTITNDDVAPTLTLIKTVTNDNGGSALVSDFPLFINDNGVTSGQVNTLLANTVYTASETESVHYTASVWGGNCAEDGTITLNEGDNKTCTITNDDIAAEISVTKDGELTVQAGDTITYTINWDIGQIGFAKNAMLVDTLPSNVDFVSASDNSATPVYDSGAGTVTWSLGTLAAPASGSETITVLTNNPEYNGTLVHNDVDFTTNDDESSDDHDTTVLSSFEVSISKDDGQTSVIPGNNLTYTLDWSVSGNSPIDNLVITDDVPANTTFVSATNGGLESAGTVTWNLGAHVPGDSGTVYMTVSVNQPLYNGTVITNLSELCGTARGIQSEVCDSDDDTTTVDSDFNVSIEKNDDVDPVQAGGNITYTLDWSVSGTSAIDSLIITDVVPANTLFVSAADGGSETAGTVSWDLGAHQPGDFGSVSFVVKVNEPLHAGTQIDNTAEICGTAQGITESVCDSDDEITTVESGFEVTITKTDDVDPVSAGDNITYTLHWTATGNSPIDNLVITDNVPADTTFVSASNGGTNTAGTVTWNLGAHVPGDSGDVTMTVTVDAPQYNGAIISNTAEICGTTQGIAEPICDTDDETTTVQAGFEVSITKSDDVDPVAAGGTLVYTLDWSVTGNSPIDTLVITDVVPANTTFVSATNGGSEAAGTVTWNLGAHVPGDSGSVQMTVTILNPLYNGTIIENRADICGTAQGITESVCDTDDETTTVTSDFEVTIDKSGPATVESGAQMTYTLAWTVSGNAPIDSLIITDAVPANTTFVSASNGGTESAGTVTWNLGPQNPDASGSVTMTVAVANLLPDGTTISNTGEVCAESNPNNQFSSFENFIQNFLLIDQDCDDDTTTTEVNSDFSVNIVKTDSVDPVQAGGQIVYNLAWSVSGNAALSSLVITDTVPANTTFVSASNGGILNAGIVTWNLGPKVPGDFGSVTMTVQTASPIANGTVISNLAQVCGTMLTAQEQNVVKCDTDDETTTVNSTPSISITKSNNVAVFANPGNTVTYTVVVSNSASATDTAHNVVMTDVLPADFTFAIDGTSTKSFSLGDIAPGASVTTTYDVKIFSGQPAGVYTNTATAQGSNTGSVSATSNVEVRVPQVLGVSAAPSMTLTKTVNPNLTVPGGIVTYTVTVTNTGDIDLTGVTLTDTLPAGFTFVEGGSRTKTWTIGTLAANHQRVFNYDVKVGDSVKNGKYENKATVMSNELDPQTAKVKVEVRKPRVLGLATTGVGLREYVIFASGLGLIALGLFWTGRLRRRYGRDQA